MNSNPPCPSEIFSCEFMSCCQKNSLKEYSATNSLLLGEKTRKIQKNHKKLSQSPILVMQGD
jgi:hypothetical protein